MSDVKQLKKKFDPNHVVINVDADGNNTRGTRRISLNTLDWLSGKVETLRKKFSAAAHEQAELEAYQKLNNNPKPKQQEIGGRKMSESDGDLLEICRKYQIASTNKYTWISEPFESIVIEYGDLLRANKIEIHRDSIDADGNALEPPRGILLLPLSSAAGQALLNFSEMGGFSLGRGSRVAKQASRALSRTHCMIYLENNRVYIKDCDSKTGTFVNGKLLGSSIPILLENFDIIQLGYGGSRDDYIQAMAVFLDDWNTKEFAASIQQLNSQQMSFSRTLSSDSLRTFYSDSDTEQPETTSNKKSLQTSPLVSSPKLTQITSHQVKQMVPKEEVIVFEKPRLIVPELEKSPVEREPEVPKREAAPIIPVRKEQETPIMKSPRMPEYAEAPKIQSEDFQVRTKMRDVEAAKVLANAFIETAPSTPVKDTPIHQDYQSIKTPVHYSSPASAKSDGYKVQYHRKDNTSGVSTTKVPSTPVVQQAQTATSTHSQNKHTIPLVDTAMSPRPPIPRPRQMKKGLSKSAENLIEVELEEIAQEVEKKAAIKETRESKETRETTASPIASVNKTKTAKMPLEAALSARKSSLQQPILNIEIPEFLKAENLKIPAISPAQELLASSKMMISCNQNKQRKISLPVGKKRPERIEKMRTETAQFTTIVQGANTKRYETLVDFGSATSDISDGLAHSQLNKKDSLKSVVNNFRINLNLESLNQSTGNKMIVEANSSNGYELSVESNAGKIRIGAVQIDWKNKLQAKVNFKIDDSVFKSISGQEIDRDTSLPLRALEQLSYFYPHLEIPSILIQGPPQSPSDKVTISLVTSKKSTQVGRIVFESQKVTWARRQMVYAVDLDTSLVEIDSLLSDTIQSVALLYCLRYHID